MKTASRLTQSELIEVMALQVRMDERRRTSADLAADDETEDKDEEEETESK